MAIKIEFIEVVMTTQKAALHFPQQMKNSCCYSDGVICAPLGAMSAQDIPCIEKSCLDLGLKSYQPHPDTIGAPPSQGDFYVTSRWDIQGASALNGCNWLHTHFGVAWNPEHPMGLNCPTFFPCFFGGFYYDSADTWQEAEKAITAYTEAMRSQQENVVRVDPVTGLMDLLLPEPYDCFFDSLAHRTLIQELKNHLNKNIQP